MQDQQKEQTGLDSKPCSVHGSEFMDYGYRYGNRDPRDIICTKCEDVVAKEKAKASSIFNRHRKLDLPPRLQSYRLESYKPGNKRAKEVLAACYDFLQDKDKSGGLVMLGGVGTGKTHLAVGICQELCDRDVGCQYTTVTKLIRRIKDTWNRDKDATSWGRFGPEDPETEKDVIQEYSTIPVLVIDEIGSQYGSDSERIMISEIINDRYNNELPTIIIANITLDEIKNTIGIRAIDRIMDHGKCLVFNWESYRSPIK